MEHTPIKLDYAGFQAARDSKLIEETVLTKYLGKNWAENVGRSSATVGRSGGGKPTKKKARPRSALASSKAADLNNTITIVPHKGAFTTKKMGLLCKCCGHMLSTHFTDLDVSGASTILATSPGVMAKRKKVTSAPRQHRPVRRHFGGEESMAGIKSGLDASGHHHHASDFGSRSKLLWEIRRSLMDDLSPIKKGKSASHRTDSLRLDETREMDEESSMMMASMATTIKDLERSNAELHEMLKKSRADDDGAGQQQQQVILTDEVKEAHVQHIASLQRQVKELEGRVGEVDAARSVAVEDRTRAEVGLKIEKAEAERMRREMERLEARIASGAEREKAIEAGRREEQEGHMREMGRKLSEQQVEFNKVVERHNEEVTVLRQQLEAEKTKSLEAAAAVSKVDRKSIEGMHEEITALQRVCLRLKSENAGLAQKIKGTEEELGRTREEMLRLESRLKLLGESHREKGALLEKGRAADEAKRTLEVQLAQAAEEVESLKKAGSDDVAEMRRMKGRIAELEGLLEAERAALAESMAAKPVVADKDDKLSGTTPRVLVERGSNAATPRAVVEWKGGSGEIDEGVLKRRISELEEMEGRMKGRIAELEDVVKRGSAKTPRVDAERRNESEHSSAVLEGIAGAVKRLEGEATSLAQMMTETISMGKTGGPNLEERQQPQRDLVYAPSPRRIKLIVPKQMQMDSTVYSTKARIPHNLYHGAERDLDEGVLRRRGNAMSSSTLSAVHVPSTSLGIISDAAMDDGVLKRRGKATNTIYSNMLAPHGIYASPVFSFASPVYSPECFSFGKSPHYDVGNRTSAVFLVKARSSPRQTPRATHTPRTVGDPPRVIGFECQYCHHDRRMRGCRQCTPGLNIDVKGENMEIGEIIRTLSGSGKELTARSHGREQDRSPRTLAR